MSRYSLIFAADSPLSTVANAIPGWTGTSLESIPSALLQSRYNIGRDQDILVFIDDPDKPGTIVVRAMRWGFTPHWIHGPNPALQPLTVPAAKTSQPYFRDAFRQRRCLIPATGFYAWLGWENGPAAPYHVRMRSQQVFLMAGIWDHCEGVDRVAMITTEANTLVRPIHDRMPAIIAPDAIDAWLRGERPQQSLLPYAPAAMETYQVTRRIFSLQNDGAELIEPIAAEPALRARA